MIHLAYRADLRLTAMHCKTKEDTSEHLVTHIFDLCMDGYTVECRDATGNICVFDVRAFQVSESQGFDSLLLSGATNFCT